MTESTPILGIPYPTIGENITPAHFQNFANAVDTATAANLVLITDALDKPMATLDAVSGQTFAVGVESSINWQLGVDSDGMFSSGTPGQITIQTPGIFYVVARAGPQLSFTTWTAFRISIFQDGVLRYAERKADLTGTPTVTPETEVAGLLSCAAASVITIRLLTSGTGGPATLFGGNLGARYVCPL